VRLSGRFGAYVPEILVPAIKQLEAAFLDAARIRASAEAGADSVLVADVPPIEADPLSPPPARREWPRC